MGAMRCQGIKAPSVAATFWREQGLGSCAKSCLEYLFCRSTCVTTQAGAEFGIACTCSGEVAR